MPNILEITNVSKDYKGFALKNINISLERGYIMGFIGPNGAGKSSTIKLIMNLIKKDSGMIEIFGLDHVKNEIEIKEKIGFVYDENYYYEQLTVDEMKNFIRPFYKHWDETAFAKYVYEFNLPIKKKIKQLSKGMKMKFSLAIALSHHAELFIMDEPTSGLDPLIRSELLEILQAIIEDENKSVFFSTHITSDLDKIADYITLIHNGEIMLSKTKDELIEDYCVVKGSKEKLSTNLKEMFIGVKVNSYGFAALSKNKKEVRQMFGDSVVIEKPTIEDIMVYLTRKGDQYASSY
ncbi:phenol-soluble modulin export ABC transporter ATP-binding protein PmtA [Calidifontibacillus oryziterrae]|uniref:phenol-soluble modulin export ABC transporter ATP-binding protein PmtA n=1 Tax=Calidifontibacillus oryziterrae TaxID=1191699 RepID=UPI0002FAE111|nr:ABC transporter ATP-binding protein [Calidifontibacillus oryziterrae]